MKYIILTQTEPLGDLINKVGKGLLIFGAVVFAIGIIIAAWRIVVFFNKGNKIIKQQQQINEARKKRQEKKSKKK